MSRTAAIGVVGATGAVGDEVLRLLEERGHPAELVQAFGSERSAGGTVRFGDGELPIRRFTRESCASLDALLLAADADTAREIAPIAIEAGLRVVDNSSAFRLDPEVPLVIPELAHTLDESARRSLLFANPNCSTILAAVVLEPLRKHFGISALSMSTYQAVSGAGREAVETLFRETRQVLDGDPVEPGVFPTVSAFNVFPHESEVDPETGANEEERKIVRELQRLWNAPELAIDPCCVRVPVERAHSQSIRVTLERATNAGEIEEILDGAPGVRLVRDRTLTPLEAAGGDEILVGRVRPTLDAQRENGETRTFRVWLCGDQLRKGAAGNALQILDALSAS